MQEYTRTLFLIFLIRFYFFMERESTRTHKGSERMKQTLC